MNQSELENLLHDVEELKRAVQRNNPFLREVVSARFYPAIGLAYGLVFILLCAAAQILIARYGSAASVPHAWKMAAWGVFGFLLLGGGIVKWAFFSRRARSLDKGANYLTVLRAVYGSSWAHLILPALICMVFAPVAAILSGHPWLMVAGIAIAWAFACNTLGLMVQRPEFLLTGWYALLSGLASLFFFEAAPFLWSGLIWGGALVIYGIVGLAGAKRGSPA
ncbi:MAG TPA: hypothetical protein VMV90_10940 [Rectinemataceae bacterium]|nr:hypothetical protein [Rectinemataceae bacterium]